MHVWLKGFPFLAGGEKIIQMFSSRPLTLQPAL